MATVLPVASAQSFTGLALGLCLLPLLSFVILLFWGKKLPRHGDWLAICTTGITLLLSLFIFYIQFNQLPQSFKTTWFNLPGAINPVFEAGFYFDNLTVSMLVLVSFISLLVQVFSVAYMRYDAHYNRYFAFLSFFTFSMLALLLVDNLLLLFVFWELVGFASYLLIGFWFQKKSASNAAKKSFLVNRVGDIGLLLGIFVFYAYFGSFNLTDLKLAVSEFTTYGTTFSGIAIYPTLLTLGGLGLFLGCVGKSAQFPLQIWLPDAMEGPTPVSSLIHAATMVAAGVYLLARCYPFFTSDALLVIAITGALTALLGAVAAMTQYDLKRIFAFSTISQLGYMVMGMGVGAYSGSLFHLFTHAFFKAALFLISGIIIHAMHQAAHKQNQHFDAQDIRLMGGLRKAMPLTFVCYLIAGAALVGLPFTSGFLSKDAIISGSWAWADTLSQNGNNWFYIITAAGFLVVLFTAYYMGRQLWLVFMGDLRQNFDVRELRLSSKSETNKLMLIPVIVLAILSLFIFFSLNPINSERSWIRNAFEFTNLNTFEAGLSGVNWPAQIKNAESNFIHLVTGLLSVLFALTGLGYAMVRYKARQSVFITSEFPKNALARFAYHHFYLDAVFQAFFVNPAQKLAKLISATDRRVLDYGINLIGVGTVVLAKITGAFDKFAVDGAVRGVTGVSRGIGAIGKNMQRGSMQRYFIFSVLGIALVISVLLIL